MNALKIKRAYDEWQADDGYRILVDRLWPRAVSKEKAKIDEWAKEVTPSTQIRKEWHAGEITWEHFAQEYRKELAENEQFPTWAISVKAKLEQQVVTFVTAAKTQPHCHVDVLKEYLLQEWKISE